MPSNHTQAPADFQFYIQLQIVLHTVSPLYTFAPYNTQVCLECTGELSIADLMKGLGEAKSKMGPARKALMKMAKQAAPLATPLPGPIRERQERKAGYETTKEDITKWQPLVKVQHPWCTLRLTQLLL